MGRGEPCQIHTCDSTVFSDVNLFHVFYDMLAIALFSYESY